MEIRHKLSVAVTVTIENALLSLTCFNFKTSTNRILYFVATQTKSPIKLYATLYLSDASLDANWKEFEGMRNSRYLPITYIWK